jgi:hypothetical protein
MKAWLAGRVSMMADRYGRLFVAILNVDIYGPRLWRI